MDALNLGHVPCKPILLDLRNLACRQLKIHSNTAAKSSGCGNKNMSKLENVRSCNLREYEVPVKIGIRI